jgi:P-type E1-E2 ATPase
VITVLVAGVILVGAVELVAGRDPAGALLGALTVLLVASPWALGLATPLSVATTLEAALKRGIIVFDETIFERLRAVDTVVFDKTGTLTTGEMTVIEASGPDELMTAAARLEQRASHPAADAIVTAFAREAPDDTVDRVHDTKTHSRGVSGTVDESTVLVGHPDLFERQGWAVSDELLKQVSDARSFGRIPVLVGRDGRAAGLIIVGDRPRTHWDEAISRLSENERDIVVLTGDDERAAEFFGQHPCVDHVFANVPAPGKTETVRRLQREGSVAMVGDGTNDAPALAQADLGLALGGGTAIASDAADIAIENDDLDAVDTTFRLARVARRRVRQNTALALCYNGLAAPLALLGFFNPLVAMAAVVVTCGLLTANTTRSFRSV